MRALSTTSKLLAYVAAALGVAAAVGLPWFAASPAAEVKKRDSAGYITLDGPVDAFFGGVWRWISASDGVSASERFAGADTALLVLAALAVVAAGLASVRFGERLGRTLMQVAALAIGVLTAVKLVQVAATDDLVEARRGAVIAMSCSVIMLMTAGHVAQQKLRRRPPAQMTSLHDPSLRAARPGSFAPPGG
jgi:hypothetical protein